MEADLEESPSIQIETRVKPNHFLTVDKEDKEYKTIISEKKIVEVPNVPSPTSQQTQEHSSTPVSYSHASQQTLPGMYPESPEELFQHAYELHKQNSDIFYESNQPLKISTISQKPFSILSTYSTIDEITPAATKTATNSFESSSLANSSYLIPPFAKNPPKFNDFLLPRPTNRPNTYPKRTNSNNKARYPNIPPIRSKPFKNFFLRSPYQEYRPYSYEFDKSNVYPIRQKPLTFNYMPMRHNTLKNPQYNRTIFGVKQVENVEISPLQASTEREPEIQTASTTNIIDIVPSFKRPAINTGFKPSSVKMESGFKPILTKEIQDRMDQSNEEIDIKDEGEIGIIDKDTKNNYEYKPVHVFEPMFVPSPTDKFAKEKNVKIDKRPVAKKHQQYLKIVIKQPRTFNETQDELVAEAAERAETYYLPPKGERPIDIVREPSNIDIESPDSDLNIDSPPDVVVTYDGKRVSGQSLTAKISERPTAFESRLSKASTFIQARPQFVKFSGELPPLNPESLFGGSPKQTTGVLSRELDTPPLPTNGNDATGSTKLSRVTRFQEGSGRT